MIRQYWDKYKDVILYLVFGVFTTVVNIVSYWFCAHVLGLGVMASSVIAWALAVFFAYVTNRTMVFHSSATGKGEILKEVGYFFACRLGTGVAGWVVMFVSVPGLHFNDMFVKRAANFLVIVLNYVLSKCVSLKH